MLAYLVGNVDANSAVVLIAIAAMLTITIGIWLAKRRSRLEITQEFELAKIKQALDHEEKQYALDTDRGFKFKQIEAGVITSHARKSD